MYRRIAWMNGVALGLLASLLSAREPLAPASQPMTDREAFVGARQAAGTVFWDDNGNGQRDPGEAGVPNVRLTGSYQVTATGPDGSYTLTGNVPFIVLSMSIPSGAWPTGAWWKRLEKDAETGVDFGLRKDRQDFPFAFVHFTDSHASTGDVPRAIYDECQPLPLKPRFYILTGDLRNQTVNVHELDKIRRDFGIMNKAIRELPAPLFAVSGNHDTVGLEEKKLTPELLAHPLFAQRTWEKFVGPGYWSFKVADVLFIGLPWAEPYQEQWDNYPSAMKAWAEGEIKREPEGTRTIGAAHTPKGPAKTLQLSGHAHTEGPAYGQANHLIGGAAARVNWNQTQTITHISDGRPVGYRLVVVEKDRIDTLYKALGEPHTIMVYSPRRHLAKPVEKEELAVQAQVFDPDQKVRNIKVALAGRETAIKTTRRTLWWDVEATCPTTALNDGFYDLTVSADWPDGHFVLTEPYLILTGRPAAWDATGPAKVEGQMAKQKQPVRVLVNGTEVGQVAAGQAQFSCEVPAQILQRLNRVSLLADQDRFAPIACSMTYDGKTYSPQVLSAGYGGGGGREMFLDLEMPGPTVPWAIRKGP